MKKLPLAWLTLASLLVGGGWLSVDEIVGGAIEPGDTYALGVDTNVDPAGREAQKASDGYLGSKKED